MCLGVFNLFSKGLKSEAVYQLKLVCDLVSTKWEFVTVR